MARRTVLRGRGFRGVPAPWRRGLRRMPLDDPIKFRLPQGFDVARVRQEFLSRDADGPFLWVYVVVVSAREPGTSGRAYWRGTISGSAVLGQPCPVPRPRTVTPGQATARSSRSATAETTAACSAKAKSGVIRTGLSKNRGPANSVKRQ
jgi:hypothetical protein